MSSSRNLDQISESIFQVRLDKDIMLNDDVTLTIRALSSSLHSQLADHNSVRVYPGSGTQSVQNSDVHPAFEPRQPSSRQGSNSLATLAKSPEPRHGSLRSPTANPRTARVAGFPQPISGVASEGSNENELEEEMFLGNPDVPPAPPSLTDGEEDDTHEDEERFRKTLDGRETLVSHSQDIDGHHKSNRRDAAGEPMEESVRRLARGAEKTRQRHSPAQVSMDAPSSTQSPEQPSIHDSLISAEYLRPRSSLSQSRHADDTIHVGRGETKIRSTAKPVVVSKKRKLLARGGASSSASIPRGSRRQRTPQVADDEKVKVFFSNGTAIDINGIQMGKLRRMGIEKTESVAECHAICVQKGSDLKRTAHVLIAALQGKDVVTDDWLISSIRLERLINLENFLAKNTAEEKKWGFRWTEVSSRGRTGVKAWQGFKIMATQDLKAALGKSFEDLNNVAKLAGASSLKVVTNKPQLDQSEDEVLLVGVGDDGLLAELRDDEKCYTKEMITISALRGKVDWDSQEFVLSPPKPLTSSHPVKKRKAT